MRNECIPEGMLGGWRYGSSYS